MSALTESDACDSSGDGCTEEMPAHARLTNTDWCGYPLFLFVANYRPSCNQITALERIHRHSLPNCAAFI